MVVKAVRLYLQGINQMAHLYCLPYPKIVSQENCEIIHNIMARVSETLEFYAKEEAVMINQTPCPEYYHKYRIFSRKDIGEFTRYVVLKVCQSEEEQALMYKCIYGWCDGKVTTIQR